MDRSLESTPVRARLTIDHTAGGRRRETAAIDDDGRVALRNPRRGSPSQRLTPEA
jgi:hypothetical protein